MKPVSADLLRYSCQLALPGFGEARQHMLQDARVLIVGAGGLGCPAAQYLAAAGLGTICIADDDTVSVGNLHRQILYSAAEVGLKKAEVAAGKLRQQNPSITIVALTQRVTDANVMQLIRDYDIVVDGSDNFETRYLLNDACVLSGKPVVYGAIYQYEGQVAVWNIANGDGSYTPHYRDVFPDADASQVPNCAEGGVIPTLAGIIGCIQANEVIKYITGTGELLCGKIFLLDAETMESRIIKLSPVSRTTITRLPETFEIPTISANDLRAHLDDGRYQLIDVRSAEERLTYHIGGEHIPLDMLRQRSLTPVAGRRMVFYCASGKRSAEAVKAVKTSYPGAEVYSLAGGLKAWMESAVENT